MWFEDWLKGKFHQVERTLAMHWRYRIKYEVRPLFKILDDSEAQPRHLYCILINGVDRILQPTFTAHYLK